METSEHKIGDLLKHKRSGKVYHIVAYSQYWNSFYASLFKGGKPWGKHLQVKHETFDKL